MSLKRTIITELAGNREAYTLPTVAEAEALFRERIGRTDANPTGADLSEMKAGYFKHFWNQIFENDCLSDPAHAITLDFLRYSAKPIRPGTAGTTESQAKRITVRTVNTANIEVPDEMFEHYLTNTIFDEVLSDDGGIMAATSYILVGGPGLGKSTLVFDACARWKEHHPDRKQAIISSEMELEDLLYEARRKPWMNHIDFVLTSEYEEDLPLALETIFLGGYHIIVLDSFADICDKLRDFCGWTTSKAETWLLNLIKRAKGGGNSVVPEEKVYTTTIAIQQQTKSGSFAGSNKLKHNTTGMIELRKEKNGDRYLTATKNRRCGKMVGKRMFYYLGANNHVAFDTERWEREISEAEDETLNRQQEQLDQAALSQFNQLDAAAMERAQAVLAGAEIRRDENGNPIIPTVPQAPPGAAPTEGELINGLTEEDIYHDETIERYVLLVNEDLTITGTSIEDVKAQARAMAGQEATI